MWDMNPRKILVGVEDTGCEAALRYAAAEALRRGCGVHLVHVAGPGAHEDVVLLEGELRRLGEAVLAEAAHRTEHLLLESAKDDEPPPVSTEVSHGTVVASLAGLSAHACLVVLQHHGMGPTGETPTLSVTTGVAARADCPVVAVPAGWQVSSLNGAVVVGVDVAAPSVPLVEAALKEAARRGARLRVVHAWRPDRDKSRVTNEEHRALLALRLADIVAEARPVAPDVQVEVVLEPGPIGHVLREQATDADLVVVGRHHRRRVIGAPLGRTARELLRWSEAPVLVVGPAHGGASTDPAPTTGTTVAP
jgi:nucleotide-binding universal stress UspA family protein